MSHPIAFNLCSEGIVAHAASIDPAAVKRLKPTGSQVPPAVLVVRRAEVVTGISVGIVAAGDVISVTDGDWANAVVVVLPLDACASDTTQDRAGSGSGAGGDDDFIDEVERTAPELLLLARETLLAIRGAHVDGKLVRTRLGKWKNEPLNTFTLKVQPRAGNIQFTLYGSPDTYDAVGFLLKDQNSYSRGWVSTVSDASKLASLVRQAHARRKK